MDYLSDHTYSILVGAALLALIFIFGFSQKRECREPKKVTYKNNQPNNNPTIHANNQTSTDEDHRTAERAYWSADIKIKNRPNRLGWVTWGLSAIAAAAAIEGYLEIERQIVIAQAGTEASREAASEAARQTVILQDQLTQSKRLARPYVIAEIGINQVSSGASGGNDGDNSYRYIAKVRFRNFGNTPAIIKHIEGVVTLSLPYRELLLNKDYATDLILAPGVATEEFSMPAYSNSAGATNVIEGTGSVYISGKITYLDVADEPMSTEFCYVWPLHSRDPRKQLVPAGGPGCYNHKT